MTHKVIERGRVAKENGTMDDTYENNLEKVMKMFRPDLVRARLGLTQADVAAMLGKDPSHVGRHESGHRGYNAATIAQYATVLKCEPWELFGYGYPPTGDADPAVQDALGLMLQMDQRGRQLVLSVAREAVRLGLVTKKQPS